MERYDVLYTRNNLSRLLARAEAGEEIEISRRGRPVARLVPIAPRKPLSGEEFAAWIAENIPASRRTRTKDEIDAYIEGERDSWD